MVYEIIKLLFKLLLGVALLYFVIVAATALLSTRPDPTRIFSRYTYEDNQYKKVMGVYPDTCYDPMCEGHGRGFWKSIAH